MDDELLWFGSAEADWEKAKEDQLERESEWSRGIHTDQHGVRHQFSDIDDKYLKNIIRYFSEFQITHDVSALQKELKERK